MAECSGVALLSLACRRSHLREGGGSAIAAVQLTFVVLRWRSGHEDTWHRPGEVRCPVSRRAR